MIQHFVLRLILPFFFLSFVVNDCKVEVKRATWNFHYGSDEEIPGVITVEECKELCLNDSDNCRGYTHTTNEVVGYCYKFKELTGMRECSTCSSGTTPEFFEGVCPFNPEDELGEEIAESAEVCWQKCFDTTGCTSFTWYDSSTPFENICFLFSKCDDLKVCSGCQSGRVNCINTPQCFQYSILDEETRNVIVHSEMYYYDISSYYYQSPRWMGNAFYRLLPPAGTVIPEKDPGVSNCGTNEGGYLQSGSHPVVVGTEVEATVSFAGRPETVSITITKCPGSYFVYKLPEAKSYGPLGRYCGAVEN